MTLVALLACATSTEPVDPRVELDAPRLLRRMSLDLRGVLPTESELDQVEADPTQLATLRDGFLEDPRLEERLVLLLAERWLTRVDDFELGPTDFHLDTDQEFALEKAVGEEPLRLMARVAVEDRPWTDTLTDETTVANELLGSIWPLDYPEGGTGWQAVRYTDGRPAVGVLATNGFWWRYVTNTSNMNRGRAAAVARLLVCQDILARPVSLEGASTLVDGLGIEEAIRTTPACVACHASVDPLASTLFGWWTVISYNPEELGNYHPEREMLGFDYLGVAPAWYGRPLGGLVDLGVAIAEDGRFPACAAETAAELLWRRPVTDADFDRVDGLRRDFLSSDLRYKQLLRAVTETPEYRVGSFVEGTADAQLDDEVTRRLLPPEVMAMAVEDLFGFRWSWGGYGQLENGDPGYRTLLGGVDGYETTRAQQDPGVTWAVGMERYAQLAATYAVAQGAVEVGAAVGEPAWEDEVRRLHWRLYAERPDDAALARASDFWVAVEARAGAEEAWTRLLSGMLRDARFVGY